MDESTLILVSFIKDLMIIVSLGILIIVLLATVFVVISLLGPIKSLKRTASNLEEASGVILKSTNDMSKTLGFFGAINRVVERIKERFSKSEE